MGRQKGGHIFSADFETTTGDENTEETKVWLGGIMECKDYADDNAVTVFETIEDFLNIVCSKKIPSYSIIYFHNLKFDGSFIINAILTDGWTRVENAKDCGLERAFSTTISDMGTWYEIVLCYKGKVVKIQNSLNLIAGSVASIGKSFKTRKQKGSIDYDAGGKHEVTEQEIEYLKADVQIMAEALNFFVTGQGFKKMTAAANALDFYIKKTYGKKDKFRRVFPELSMQEDAFCRRAYTGGACILKETEQVEVIERYDPGFSERNGGITGEIEVSGKMFGGGITLDVNSEHPFSMHSSSGNPFPYGAPVHYEGKYEQDDLYPLWIGSCTVTGARVKPRHIPCMQIKGNPLYNSRENLKEFGIGEPVTITVTSAMWELLKEQYDFESVTWLEGYKFMAAVGLFDEYINHWYQVKAESTGALRSTAKLMQNGLYGKFGTSPIGGSKVPSIGVNGETVFSTIQGEEMESIYLPVAAFTTSYSRRYIVRNAQSNYDRFIYMDTDSLHLIGKEVPSNVWVDDKAIGAFKKEGDWSAAKFLRAKAYMEKEESGGFTIKCAGMPERVKYNRDGTARFGFEDFRVGAAFQGKLLPKQVRGGVILVPVDYVIHEK